MRPTNGLPRGGVLIGLLAAMLFYVVLLHFTYRELVAPAQGYQGFTYRSPALLNYAGAIGLVLVLTVILPRNISRVSDFVLWVLFATAGAPSILITQYADILPLPLASLVGFHVALCMAMLRIIVLARPQMGLHRSWVGYERLFMPTILALIGITLGYMALTGLLSFRALSFSDVYVVRAQVEDQTQGDPIIGYLVPTVHKVLGPLLLGCGIVLRRWLLVIAGLVTQYVCYTSLGSKTIIIAVIGVGLVCMLFRRSESPRATRFIGGATVALAVTVGIDVLRSSSSLTFFGVRRLEVVPGVLTSAYVKVFNDFPKVNFADSLLFFLRSPYDRSPQLIVGEYFLGDDRSSASVNLWGDGFANYGFIGMYIATLILGVGLWVVDDVTHDLPMSVACSIMLMPAAAVGESGVFTLMLSHGFIAGIVVCALLPRTWFGNLAARGGGPRGRQAVCIPPQVA